MILIIRTLRPIKDHKTVLEQQPDPSPNATKVNEIFMISGDNEMVQHIIPINKLELKDIFSC